MSDHDNSFFKTFVGVLGILVAIAFIIFFVAQYVIEASGIGNDAEAQAIRDAAIAKRIEPEGKVRMMGDAELAPAAASADASGPKSAKDIVAATCSGCHGSGVLGAPKIGSKSDWEPRYAQGLDTLVTHAINGKGSMPPRGGNAALSDDEVKAAIEQMLSDSGIDVPVTDLTGGAAAPAADAAPAVTESPASEAAAAAAETSATPNAAVTAAAEKADAADEIAKGKSVYEGTCVACHSVGVAGAPRFGDKEAWAARIAQGMDTLNQHALKGFRGMPPKGGRMDLADADIVAAVAYMVANAK